jgi:hypothetical protein
VSCISVVNKDEILNIEFRIVYLTIKYQDSESGSPLYDRLSELSTA